MKKLIIAAVLSLFALPSYASSLPDADIVQKFSIGTGPSISVDFKLNPKVSLGGSLGTPFYRGAFLLSGLYDIRLLYKFVDNNNFALSGLIGAAGDPPFAAGRNGSPIGVEAGIAMSYKFLPQLTGRLNLVGSVPFSGYGSGFYFFSYLAPASGVEIAYKFNKTFELTFGGNGQGDVLGLNIFF